MNPSRYNLADWTMDRLVDLGWLLAMGVTLLALAADRLFLRHFAKKSSCKLRRDPSTFSATR